MAKPVDRRNLPEAVRDRLAREGLLDGYGVRARGSMVEAGHQLRGRPSAQRLEVRKRAGGEQPVLDGYAALWHVTYPVAGGKASAFGWDETIVAGAVDKSLAEQDDVYWLFDHDGLSVASTKAGTLEVTSDSVGLSTVARPNMASTWNSEIVLRVQDGDIDAMSWAFTATRQEWNADYTERWITEARIWDVSGVKWPANEATVLMSRDTVRPVGTRDSRMDAEDLGVLGQMLALGTTYIAEQDEPGDVGNVAPMTEAIALIASLIPGELAEDEPTEDESDPGVMSTMSLEQIRSTIATVKARRR